MAHAGVVDHYDVADADGGEAGQARAPGCCTPAHAVGHEQLKQDVGPALNPGREQTSYATSE